MAKSKPITIFGIHSMAAENRTSGLPYGIVKVLGNYAAAQERESIDLFGGSNPNAWDSEDGNVSGDLTLTVKEFHPMLLELAGYSKTENAAEASGSVNNLANKYGTTVSSTSIGIDSIAVKTGGEDDLKDGKYTIRAVGADTVDIYAFTDISFEDGTNTASYQDDLLKVNASPITVPDGSTVDVDELGITITGGTTVGFTVDNTAQFEIRSINTGSYEFTYGETPTPIEFAAHFYSQKKASGEFSHDFYPRVKFASVPSGMTEKDWMNFELTLKILADTTEGFSGKRNTILK